MQLSIRSQYDAEVRVGHIDRDAAQEAIVQRLDALNQALAGYQPARKSAALGWLFGAKPESGAPKGLYIWGGVGRGKSMLMDMFFDRADVPKKRRVHFHAFMAEVHGEIFQWRQALKKGWVKGEDPIEPVAEEIAKSAWLLCFDEFTVTDIADAMILGRLFKALFARGVVVVATSNVEPSDLYKEGLNRSLFLPSIALIEEKMHVLKLDSRTDFRMEKLAGSATFHVPADVAAHEALTKAFRMLTGVDSGNPTTVKVLGRLIDVPQSRGNVARFSFADLCEAPLGAQDYLAIARRYHTVIIDDIPIIKASQVNEAKRFIILIDAFYEAHIKLFASAAAVPAQLFVGTDGREAFEFARTVSRLVEMQSSEYMALPHGRAGTLKSGNMEGIVDT
ncbi:cell division protein ZapE [Beijerinckia sp. L45]|uniref:cell division protein ZapE n=1 Tax=Beijerinckia sp. L45 TaxID=1641855 RepID=UPI00131E3A7F|nr:cell division protein ZapE [Beijerinckia sp. L45]